MLRLSRPYVALAVALFAIEVLIARYVHDRLVRPYIGDVLVVILIYCFVRAFIDTPVRATAVGVLAFSFAIEALQYLEFVKVLGLEHNKLARIVLGTSFAWGDLVAYAAGCATVIAVEAAVRRRR